MIQRFASIAAAPWLCLFFAIGCAGNGSRAVPRMLGGTPVRGAFVPPSSYEAYVRGELLLAEGRPEQARAQLELATTAPDEDAYLLSRLAYAELMSGDRAAALRTLAHAEELDGCSEAVFLTRGALAERAGDLSAARLAYGRALECAPASPAGVLALARVLRAHGDPFGALDLLVSARGRPFAQALESSLRGSLREADAASLAHALRSLSLTRALDASLLAEAVQLALAHGLPRLARELASEATVALPPELEAELLLAERARAGLRVLLDRHLAAELGGHARTAQLALYAGAFERAELEASSALDQATADELFAVRARAALGLGRPSDARSDIAAIRDPALRRTLLLEALAGAGAPALSRELARLPAREPDPTARPARRP